MYKKNSKRRFISNVRGKSAKPKKKSTTPTTNTTDDNDDTDEVIIGDDYNDGWENLTVQFSLTNVLIPIFNEREWLIEYAEARRGTWVSDAYRFKERIKNLEKLLNQSH